MTQKLLLRDPPRRRVINGRPASCRTCRYVMDPKFPLVPAGKTEDKYPPEHFAVVCCREGPPQRFRWERMDVEPFCGRHAASEGEVAANEVASEAAHHGLPEPPHAATAVTSQPTARPEPPVVRMEIPTFGAPAPSSSAQMSLDRIDLGSVSLSLRPGTQE